VRQFLCFALLFSCFYPATVYAKPKEKIYKNTPTEVFQAALRTAREKHVVTFVDQKNLMMTFETGVSMMSYGFVANASVEQLPDETSKLIINVQHKNTGQNQSFSFNAGDRMADKFFVQVDEELARKPTQKVAVKPDAVYVDAPPDAKPTTVKEQAENAAVTVNSTPDGADISVDGSFVGNAPSTLKLLPGKHTVSVSAAGYKGWSRELTVVSGSEIKLNATLEKQ
jgi:hypothetical protein